MTAESCFLEKGLQYKPVYSHRKRVEPCKTKGFLCVPVPFTVVGMLFCSFFVLFVGLCHAFQLNNNVRPIRSFSHATLHMANEQDPLLLRAARGEEVERIPVWMMRQAGRHMKSYRELCKVHKTFRDRSENVDVSTEIRYLYA